MGGRGGAVGGDQDAFPCRQAVGLDYVRGAEGVQRLADLGRRAAGAGSAGGDAGRLHEVLGEGLGALDHRGGAARAETGEAGLPQGVSDSGYKRGLWADDDQVRFQVLREPDNVRRA